MYVTHHAYVKCNLIGIRLFFNCLPIFLGPPPLKETRVQSRDGARDGVVDRPGMKKTLPYLPHPISFFKIYLVQSRDGGCDQMITLGT